jgi:hypothetical protein
MTVAVVSAATSAADADAITLRGERQGLSFVCRSEIARQVLWIDGKQCQGQPVQGFLQVTKILMEERVWSDPRSYCVGRSLFDHLVNLKGIYILFIEQ